MSVFARLMKIWVHCVSLLSAVFVGMPFAHTGLCKSAEFEGRQFTRSCEMPESRCCRVLAVATACAVLDHLRFCVQRVLH